MEELEQLAHESKYVLRPEAAAAARVLLRGVARPERPFSSGIVDTIYFDDWRLSSWAEKRASELRKSKFRLRWYDGGGDVFLECKQRYGSRRRKLRTPVALAAPALSRDGLRALAGVSLTPFAAALGVPLAADLGPTVHLRYRRERFVAPDGARLCLDWEIAALAAAPRLAGRGRAPIALPVAVFEVKGTARSLPAACRALGALGARRASFSKYAACLEALAR